MNQVMNVTLITIIMMMMIAKVVVVSIKVIIAITNKYKDDKYGNKK